MSDDREAIALMRAHLQVMDQALTRSGLTNKEQMSVASMAAALALRRVIGAGMVAGRPLNRGERTRLRTAAMADFEAKLKEYSGDGDNDDRPRVIERNLGGDRWEVVETCRTGFKDALLKMSMLIDANNKVAYRVRVKEE